MTSLTLIRITHHVLSKLPCHLQRLLLQVNLLRDPLPGHIAGYAFSSLQSSGVLANSTQYNTSPTPKPLVIRKQVNSGSKVGLTLLIDSKVTNIVSGAVIQISGPPPLAGGHPSHREVGVLRDCTGAAQQRPNHLQGAHI